jgi:hypothetical protein
MVATWIATNGDRRGDQEMTAAQNTIQLARPNRLAGLAAAAAIGLAVAVVGVAISARPVDAPASAQTLAPSQTSSLAFEELLSKAHAPAIAPSQTSSLVFEELLSKAHAPSEGRTLTLDQIMTQADSAQTLAPSQSLTLDEILNKAHAPAYAPSQTPLAYRFGGPHRG